MLIVEDDAYLDEFIDDASDILKRMGKIDEGGVRRQHITGLLRSVNSADATFHSTQDENLAPRQLYVCDRIGDFFQSDASSSFAARYLIERFGHIVDHRYLVLVGSRADLTKFIGLSPLSRCCSASTRSSSQASIRRPSTRRTATNSKRASAR